MIPRLTGLRLHCWSSLFRGVAATMAIIYSSTLFILQVGAPAYTQLIFFFFISGVVLYSTLLFISAARTHGLYLYFLILEVAGLVLLWIFGKNNGVIYGFAVMALVADSFSDNFVILALPQDPIALFRECLHGVTLYALIGNILGSLIMIGLSHTNYLSLFFPFMGTLIGLHLVLQIKVHGQLKETHGPERSRSLPAAEILRTSRASLEFIWKDPLIYTALVGLIWARISKFCMEATFYNKLNNLHYSGDHLTSTISLANLGIIGLAVVLQKWAVPPLTKRLPIYYAFALLPGLVALLASAGLIDESLGLIIFAYIVYRSLHVTMFVNTFRICLLPAPKKLRDQIFTWVILLSLAVNVVVSGALSGIKSLIQVPEFLAVLVFISLGFIYYSSHLNSAYIRNLWKTFREYRDTSANFTLWNNLSPEWLKSSDKNRTVENSNLNQSLQLLKNRNVDNETASINAKSLLDDPALSTKDRSLGLLDLFRWSYHFPSLSFAAGELKKLIFSSQAESQFWGLKLVQDIQSPVLESHYEHFEKSPFPNVSAKAHKAQLKRRSWNEPR